VTYPAAAWRGDDSQRTHAARDTTVREGLGYARFTHDKCRIRVDEQPTGSAQAFMLHSKGKRIELSVRFCKLSKVKKHLLSGP
jgi:hypothetical protein